MLKMVKVNLNLENNLHVEIVEDAVDIAVPTGAYTTEVIDKDKSMNVTESMKKVKGVRVTAETDVFGVIKVAYMIKATIIVKIIKKLRGINKSYDIGKVTKAKGIEEGDVVEEGCVREVVRSKILSCPKIRYVKTAKCSI